MPAAIEADLQAIEGADLLVVASPVYRGSDIQSFYFGQSVPGSLAA